MRPALRGTAASARAVPADRAARMPAAPAEDRFARTLVVVFLLSLIVPGSISVGPVNLTVYRAVLIATCIPLGLRWITGRAGPVSIVDLLYLACCLWIAVALVAVHGMSRIVFIGSNFVELFGAYLLGRVLVRDAESHRHFVRSMLLLLVLLFPIALIEFLTSYKVLRRLFSPIMSMREEAGPMAQQRLGFTRAATSFSHPIHFGLFGSVIFANAYFLYWRGRARTRIGVSAFVAFVTMLAISSGALFSLVLQTAMITWDRTLAFLRGRWWIGVGLGVATLGILFVSVQGGLVTYIVENLIFAPGAGEHRLDIYYYGTLQVLNTPWFGVGLGDWARPFWRPHPTIDSFWMMTAIRSGLPAVIFLMTAILFGMVRIAGGRGLDDDAVHYRAGYMIALSGLLLMLSTVHIWGPITVFVMAYLGAGSWFYTGDQRLKPAETARQRRERAAELRAGGPGKETGKGSGQHEAIVRPGSVGYDRGPVRRRGISEAVESGTAGRGAGTRGAEGTKDGPNPR